MYAPSAHLHHAGQDNEKDKHWPITNLRCGVSIADLHERLCDVLNEITEKASFKFDHNWQKYVEAFVEFKEILGIRIDNYGSMNPLHRDLVLYMLYNWPGFHVLRLSRILRVESPSAADKLNSALSDRQSLEPFDLPRYGLKTANKHIQKEAVKEVYSLVKAFVDAFDEQYDLFCHEFRRVELNDDLRRLVKEAQQTGTRPAEDLKRLEDEASKTRVEIRKHAEQIVTPRYKSPFSKTEVTDIPSEANDMRRRNVHNLSRACKSLRKSLAEFEEDQERRRELHKHEKELTEKELKRLNEELSDSVELFRDAFREKFIYWFSTKSKTQKLEERERVLSKEPSCIKGNTERGNEGGLLFLYMFYQFQLLPGQFGLHCCCK